MSTLKKSNTIKSKKNQEHESYRFRKSIKFSTKRRSQKRDLSIDDQITVNEWFNVFDIIIESMIRTSEQQNKVKRLFYTWRDCFAMKMTNIKTTNLMKHLIVLKSGFKFIKEKIPRYTLKKREFANQIFSQMKKTDIIVCMNSDWEARIKFSFKKKNFDQLRVVHNYISLNDCTVKMQYSVHRIEEVIDILMKSKFKTFFSTDATWGYWAVTTKKKNVYKTKFVSSHEQWAYLRMRMSLTESSHTYAQFPNLMFEPLSVTKNFSAEEIIIENHEEATMTSFVNDHFEVEISFETLFDFLHEHYFSRTTFELIYLNSKKIIVFIEKLNMIEFIEESNELRSFIKHKIKILKWLISINRLKLNEFLWLTSFLRQFIPDRANHVLIMKKAYMIQVSAKPTRIKSKAKMKECDRDLIKTLRKEKTPKITKKTVRRQWVKRSNDEFVWDQSQQASFDHVKKNIIENAMTTTVHELQYHLTTNASKRTTSAYLFQISRESLNTIMTSSLKDKFKIIMFMSFRLNDAEIRYFNTKRECLVIVNAFVEVRWLIVESNWKTICYIDHHALNSIMIKESNDYDRIVIWQDRLREYDIKVIHRSAIDSMIDIADDLSRLSMKLIIKYRIIDQERSFFMSEDDDSEENDSISSKKIINAIVTENWIRSTRKRRLDAEHDVKEWERYDWCSLFKHMIAYLRQELKEIEDLSRQERKMIINQFSKYSLTSNKSLLMYHEKNERRSSCLTKDQIDPILKHLHDEHEHYSHVIILNRMKDEVYWSIRTQDVIIWCKSCSACQLNANKHLTAVIKHVLTFESMSMIELDFLESIKSACAMIECRYILLEVNYFSRFVWARSYVHCTMIETANLMNNMIASIFEWSKAIYSNNDKHFIEYDFEKLLKARDVMHFTISVTHSSSVSLIERMIQLMIRDIRKRCIQRRESKAWALDVTDETIAINTRKIKVH